MKILTDQERKQAEIDLRAAGERAFKRGQYVTALSPLVPKWRRAAWIAGWKAAKLASKQVSA